MTKAIEKNKFFDYSNQKTRTQKEHRKSGKITKIIKLDYIVEVHCWCGKDITIDSSKDMMNNVCLGCGSPYTLINEEWTQEKIDKFKKEIKEKEQQIDK